MWDLEVPPLGLTSVRLAIHGEIIERDIGTAGVKYSGQEAIVEIVFATDVDPQVLGVTTLESLGYRVNPITEELEYAGLLAI